MFTKPKRIYEEIFGNSIVGVGMIVTYDFVFNYEILY